MKIQPALVFASAFLMLGCHRENTILVTGLWHREESVSEDANHLKGSRKLRYRFDKTDGNFPPSSKPVAFAILQQFAGPAKASSGEKKVWSKLIPVELQPRTLVEFSDVSRYEFGSKPVLQLYFDDKLIFEGSWNTLSESAIEGVELARDIPELGTVLKDETGKARSYFNCKRFDITLEEDKTAVVVFGFAY